MKLWRVILSIHIRQASMPAAMPGYSYTTTPATFYMHAVSASDVQTMAIALVSAGVSPHDEYRTSGSVIAVDGNLEPLDWRCGDPDCKEPLHTIPYLSWNDMERAA